MQFFHRSFGSCNLRLIGRQLAELNPVLHGIAGDEHSAFRHQLRAGIPDHIDETAREERDAAVNLVSVPLPEAPRLPRNFVGRVVGGVLDCQFHPRGEVIRYGLENG